MDLFILLNAHLHFTMRLKQRFNTFRPKEFIAAYTMLYFPPPHSILCNLLRYCCGVQPWYFLKIWVK